MIRDGKKLCMYHRARLIFAGSDGPEPEPRVTAPLYVRSSPEMTGGGLMNGSDGPAAGTAALSGLRIREWKRGEREREKQRENIDGEHEWVIKGVAKRVAKREKESETKREMRERQR
jgi:hypothetical protein